jgi:hypothetical protein
MLLGPIAPLAPAFEMDAVERALRSGGERDAAKKSEEDAGTIAGAARARPLSPATRARRRCGPIL